MPRITPISNAIFPNLLPKQRSTALFSAILSSELEKLINVWVVSRYSLWVSAVDVTRGRRNFLHSAHLPPSITPFPAGGISTILFSRADGNFQPLRYRRMGDFSLVSGEKWVRWTLYSPYRSWWLMRQYRSSHEWILGREALSAVKCYVMSFPKKIYGEIC